MGESVGAIRNLNDSKTQETGLEGDLAHVVTPWFDSDKDDHSPSL